MLKIDGGDATASGDLGVRGWDWVGFALAAVAVPVPLASFYITLSYIRLDLGVNGTSVIFTIVVAGAFSLVLIASLLTNAVIISVRMLRRSEWHVSRTLVVIQVALLAAIALWLVSLAGAYDTPESNTLFTTMASASAIVGLSIAIFVFALMPAPGKPRATGSSLLVG